MSFIGTLYPAPTSVPANVTIGDFVATTASVVTNFVVNIPATVADGDLMVMTVSLSSMSGVTLTPPPGWATVINTGDGGINSDLFVLTKSAKSEASTCTVVFSASTSPRAVVMVFKGAKGVGNRAAAATFFGGALTLPTIKGNPASLIISVVTSPDVAGAGSIASGVNTLYYGISPFSASAPFPAIFWEKAPVGVAIPARQITNTTNGSWSGAVLEIQPGENITDVYLRDPNPQDSFDGWLYPANFLPAALPKINGPTSATAISQTSVTVNVPAGVANGDLLLMAIATAGTAALPVLAGWNFVLTTADASGLNAAVNIWARNAKSEPASYTYNFGGATNATATIIPFTGSGYIGASAFNVANSGTSTTLPTITGKPNSLVLSFLSSDGNPANFGSGATTILDTANSGAQTLKVAWEAALAGTPIPARQAFLGSSGSFASAAIEITASSPATDALLNRGTGPVAPAAGPSPTGAGAMAGVGAVAAVGASLAADVGAIAGTGALSGAGNALLPAIGAMAGTGALTGVGAALFAGVGALAGAGALSATGAALGAGAGAIAGVGSLAGTGASQAASGGALAGVGALTATGAALGAGAGAIAGVGALTATGAALFAGVGSLAGVGALNGTGAANFAGVGAMTGVGALNGIGQSASGNVGIIAGTGALTGVGAALFAGLGSITGSGALSGVGAANFAATGAMTGTSALTGLGASIWRATGTMTGVGALIGVGQSTSGGVGSIAGTSSLTGIGAALFAGAATMTGTGALAGVGAALFAATGSTAGIGALMSTGASIWRATGTMTGVGLLLAVGAIASSGVPKRFTAVWSGPLSTGTWSAAPITGAWSGPLLTGYWGPA